MAVFQAKTNRKQISIILNLIKRDCVDLYGEFHLKKPQLKHAIELYEEFMTQEINTLFVSSNRFSEIVLKHRENFKEFVKSVTKEIILDDGTPQETVTNGISVDGSVYVMFISLQEWLIQGPKCQQFYYMIDIDSFRYSQRNEIRDCNIAKQRDDINRTNGVAAAKMAKLKAVDFVNETFIAFKQDKPIDCDNQMANNIKRQRYFLKKKEAGIVFPVKCVFLLLNQVFFGVSKDDTHDTTTKTFKCNVCVSYDFRFSYDSKISEIDAQNHASLKALQDLCDIENKFVQRERNHNFPANFAVIIQNLIVDNFKKNTDVDLNIRSNVLAGVVQTIGNNLNDAKAVVLATGTKNIDAMELEEDAVPDTHAEVVARRCLMVYFYDQIELYLDSAKTDQSIFEKSPYDGRLKVKENIQFHLYISKGPCGDATAFGTSTTKLNHRDRGCLMAMVEKSESRVKLIDLTEAQDASDLQHKPLYTITCSDKIARWNVVGVQGALLSRIIEPIYFDSIVLGKSLHYDHITNSFYGRIENSIGCLPRFYYHNKPHIAFTESGRRNTHHEAPKVSFNWIINRFNVEKIESKTGKLIPPKSGISRLSKRSLLRNFETIKQRMAHINTGRRLTYADEKALATDFQIAKNECIEAFIRRNLGNWKFAQKPAYLDGFFLDINP